MMNYSIPRKFIEYCQREDLEPEKVLGEIIEKYISSAVGHNAKQPDFAKIRYVILDVDGVLTDGKMILGAGETIKAFNSLDGFGIKAAMASGVDVGIITAHKSAAVARRCEMLGITQVYMGYDNKIAAFKDLVKINKLDPDEIAYMGDDILDLPVMRKVGLPVAVANASRDVKEEAAYITHASGGAGAVREVLEMILREKGKWQDVLSHFVE